MTDQMHHISVYNAGYVAGTLLYMCSQDCDSSINLITDIIAMRCSGEVLYDKKEQPLVELSPTVPSRKQSVVRW
jgi:hypothetical protein